MNISKMYLWCMLGVTTLITWSCTEASLVPSHSETRTSLGVYPIYNVQGDHGEVGYQLGKLGRKRIQDYINNYPNINKMRSWIWREGNEDFNELLNANYYIYHDYIDELSALSEGAGIGYTDILIMAFRQEVETLMNLNVDTINSRKDYNNENGTTLRDKIRYRRQCSDILVKNANNFIGIGHNEDGWNGTLNTGYFVNASYPNNYGTKGNASYIFGFSYPGMLFGTSFSFNNFGLFTTIDSVFPYNISVQSRGIYFIERSLLDCDTINCVIAKINDSTNGTYSTYGASITVGQGSDIINIEIAPYELNIKNLSDTFGDKYDYHFNNYLRLTDVDSLNDIGSDHRLNRTKEIIESKFNNTIKNISQIIDILGDTKDQNYPIYQNGETRNASDDTTLATVIFDMNNGFVKIFEQCNPKDCPPSKLIQI